MTAHPCKAFEITRVFAAPRQRVWDAWTKPDQYSRWFGPKGSSSEVRTFDLRPGGMLHSRMVSAEGQEMWARFDYREVTPPSKLVWVHGFSDAGANRVRAPFPGQFPMEMLTTVIFADEGKQTRITLTWEPIDPTAAECETFEAMIPGMHMGWGGSFEQLDAFLAEG